MDRNEAEKAPSVPARTIYGAEALSRLRAEALIRTGPWCGSEGGEGSTLPDPYRRGAARHFNITGPCFSVRAMPRHEDETFRLLCASLGRRGVPARFALASEVNSETFAALQALAETE